MYYIVYMRRIYKLEFVFRQKGLVHDSGGVLFQNTYEITLFKGRPGVPYKYLDAFVGPRIVCAQYSVCRYKLNEY